MFLQPGPYYGKIKSEEEKSMMANRRAMIYDALFATSFTTATNLWAGFGIYQLSNQEGSSLEKIALGAVVAAIACASNLATYDVFSDTYQNEKNALETKKKFSEAVSKKDRATIDSLISKNEYLPKWAERFKKKEWTNYLKE